MSHPTQLINDCIEKLNKHYPESDGFKFIRERRLIIGKRNVQPDIQVISPAGLIVCAVEIGYTRPEKLSFYRELKIPDVRWYSKDGTLHTTPGLELPTEHKKIVVKEIPDERFKFVVLPVVGAYCEQCFQEEIDSLTSEFENAYRFTGVEIDENVLYDTTLEINTVGDFFIIANQMRRTLFVCCYDCGCIGIQDVDTQSLFVDGAKDPDVNDNWDSVYSQASRLQRRMSNVRILDLNWEDVQSTIAKFVGEHMVVEIGYDELREFLT